MQTDATDAGSPLSWPGALRVAVSGQSLRRTLAAAFVVGTTLTVANLGGSLLSEGLTAGISVKLALTYLVPWGNATFGIAVGQRDRSAKGATGTGARSDP